jgi:hypothetical protein
MLKRCIGIDIGSFYISALQVMRTAEECCIEKLFCTQIRRSTDSPVDILRLLFSRYGFDRRAEVAVSMPHDTVFFRELKTDSAGLEQIREKNWSALEHNFPVEPEKIIAQVYSCHPLPDGKYSVLTAATSGASLQERQNIFIDAKLHPSLVESPIFAVHSAVAVNHPEIMTGRAIIAYIDEGYLTLAVTGNNDVLVVRSIPVIAGSDSNIDSVQEQIAEILSREAQITWRKVFGSGIEQDTNIYLVTADKISGYLTSIIEDNLHCQTTIVDCCSKVKGLPEHKTDMPICIAEGLALRILAPEQTKGVNFLEAENAHTEPALDLKKELGVCAALIGAIAVFLLVGLFMRLSRLEAHYLSLKNQTKEIFKAALPEEKNIVSPLAQLEQKLESLQKDSRLFASLSPTHLVPLDVLYRISTNTPSQANVKVDDILIADNTVRVSGTCDSFESVYQWQRLLEEIPGFEYVDVKDVQKQPKSGIVSFTLLMSSSMKETK